MTLPVTADITAAMAFVDDVWTAIPMLALVFALVVAWKVGPYVLRKMFNAIPG